MNTLTPWISALSLLALITAGANIYLDYRGPLWGKYLTKPLVMFWILLLALLSPSSAVGYKNLLLIALLFSTAGDVFLMLSKDFFLKGLVSFLIAHLFFIGALSQGLVFDEIYFLIVLPLLGYGAFLLKVLWPHLKDKLKIPILLYMLVITSMGTLACLRWLGNPSLSSSLAALAGGLFIFSDSILALNRFRSPFPSAQFWVLSSYFSSQWLFALSVYTLA